VTRIVGGGRRVNAPSPNARTSCIGFRTRCARTLRPGARLRS